MEPHKYFGVMIYINIFNKQCQLNQCKEQLLADIFQKICLYFEIPATGLIVSVHSGPLWLILLDKID